MERFFIEVPHEAEPVACARVVQAFLQSGSHFLTNADWGCKDGVHKGWIMVEAENKEAARAVLPPAFRNDATIVGLNKFSMEEIDDILSYHQK